MKILAAIVIYNPDWSLLGDNIRAFYDHVDHILVWNNSDARIRLSDIRGLQPFFQKTTYKTLHKNVGIAQALNYAWHYAKEHGYDTLLTMDDDSVFEDYGTYRQRVEQHWQANGLSLCGPAAQPTKERGMQKVRHRHCSRRQEDIANCFTSTASTSNCVSTLHDKTSMPGATTTVCSDSATAHRQQNDGDPSRCTAQTTVRKDCTTYSAITSSYSESTAIRYISCGIS